MCIELQLSCNNESIVKFLAVSLVRQCNHRKMSSCLPSLLHTHSRQKLPPWLALNLHLFVQFVR